MALVQFAIFFLFTVYCAECVRVTTKQGVLEGSVEKSRGGRDFFSFYRIPYAEPPVGDLRFEAPIPHKPWTGIWNATILPAACIFQDNDGSIVGEEDCLYLNLYTPKLTMESLLPVMVFVYGGRFMYGDALPGRYGPHYFMDKDIILITFHYRQGPFGFLSTEDEIMPGNYGFKDFVAVLEWVQENIESFGGDKNRVTIAGGSSGGSAVTLALVSPLAEGLFHRCISQSGYWFLVDPPGVRRSQAWKFSSLVGCDDESVSTSEELKSCLKKVPAEDMAKHNHDLYTILHLRPVLPFGAVIENEKIPGAFLVDQPIKLLERVTNIPWLLGMNSADGGIRTMYLYFNFDSDRSIIEEISKHFQKYLPLMFEQGWNTGEIEKLFTKNLTEIVKQRYFGDDEIIDNPRGFSQLCTDILVGLLLKRSVEVYKGTKYLYYYDHRNKESFDKFYGKSTEDMGVLHGDELISMFNWSDVITPVTEGIDLVVSEQVLNLWTNFVIHGNPNGKAEEELWKPTESSRLDYLYIKDGQLEMRTDLRKSNFEFWNNIFHAYHDHKNM